MDSGTLDLFEAELRRAVPNLKVRFKDESLVQRVLGVLAYPFNPDYLTTYASTFGSSVYFPSRKDYVGSPMSSLVVLAHEFVHICDSRQDKLFQVKYALPQAFAVVPLVVYAILAGSHAWVLLLPFAGYLTGALLARKSRAAFLVSVVAGLASLVFFGWALTGWKLLVLLGLVCLAPWPSPWRTEYELRGYGMTIAVAQWCTGRPLEDYQSFIADQFTGSGYYYMCRDRAYVDRTIEATRQQAEVGALQGISPYGVVYDFLYSQQLLRKPRA